MRGLHRTTVLSESVKRALAEVGGKEAALLPHPLGTPLASLGTLSGSEISGCKITGLDELWDTFGLKTFITKFCLFCIPFLPKKGSVSSRAFSEHINPAWVLNVTPQCLLLLGFGLPQQQRFHSLDHVSFLKCLFHRPFLSELAMS